MCTPFSFKDPSWGFGNGECGSCRFWDRSSMQKITCEKWDCDFNRYRKITKLASRCLKRMHEDYMRLPDDNILLIAEDDCCPGNRNEYRVSRQYLKDFDSLYNHFARLREWAQARRLAKRAAEAAKKAAAGAAKKAA